ncbi:MAG: RNA-directed DNA polymerase [Bacteroidota bacterium]|nr:RNA-directed DNA polymerase [Bacteroidota bacterium]
MEVTEKEVAIAYHRLKTHVYYDTSDLFIRRQLAIFETNIEESFCSFFNVNKEYSTAYNQKAAANEFTRDSFWSVSLTLKFKFEVIANAINKDRSFFSPFFKKMEIRYMPKSFVSSNLPLNFITNKRVQQKYNVERLTAFIDIPIELHIITVLWIMKYGHYLDNELSDYAYGNRLLLNQEKSDLVQGSSLFKPYYKQYQNWRDNSIKIVKTALEDKQDVMFINLDIKDYYYSVRLDLDSLMKVDKLKNKIKCQNLLSLFKGIHKLFTKKIKSKNLPKEYGPTITKNEVTLPIGLLSSFILGNHYLKKLDDNVIKNLKPLYYGRYVDDILFVIKSPSYVENLYDEIDKSNNQNGIENIINKELPNIIEIIKHSDDTNSKESSNLIKLKLYNTLFCQPDKTLLYYFDHLESDLVIDRLKREMDLRSSEFRDIPFDDADLNFEDKAYHFLYDGSEGKIKTLKDFKEDRYGLSIYLSSKIYIALKHNKKIDALESKKILKFFMGLNCLEFYRLWEKVLTFFLINNDPAAFVEFYTHTYIQIDKIDKIKSLSVKKIEINKSLKLYLDHALEMALALNPYFVCQSKSAHKKLVFFQTENKELYNCLVGPDEELTNEKAYHISRFRESNLIRHQYIAQPLLNYTNLARDKHYNLTGLALPFKDSYNKILEFDEISKENSPRQVRFWECCLAIIHKKIANIESKLTVTTDDHLVDLFNLETANHDSVNPRFYLDEAFELYKSINSIHLPDHILNYDKLKESFFSIVGHENINNNCDLIEFRINALENLDTVRIAFANTKVDEQNIHQSINGNPNLSVNRFRTIQKIFKQTRDEKANMLLLPENSLPYQLLSSLCRFSVDNSVLSIAGLEHWTINNYSLNFIVTVLPVVVNNINEAVVLIRLKNHYAHSEKNLILGEHLFCPKPSVYRYDLINWRNIYFTSFYCFELANISHRCLFRSKIDLLIVSEYNKDTPFYSNLVESASRDIHAYVAQVNTSQYGDSRLIKPSSSETKDILKLKGGENDTVLIGKINFKSLRTFQRLKYNATINNKEFKPLPPDFDYQNAINREKNKFIIPLPKDAEKEF